MPTMLSSKCRHGIPVTENTVSTCHSRSGVLASYSGAIDATGLAQSTSAPRGCSGDP